MVVAPFTLFIKSDLAQDYHIALFFLFFKNSSHSIGQVAPNKTRTNITIEKDLTIQLEEMAKTQNRSLII